jgi:glucokinase
MVASRDVFWAVDIGGTKVEIGIGDRDGHWVAARRLPTDELGSGPVIVERLAAALRQDAATAGVSPRAVGIGCPGPLDVARGVILTPANLPAWKDLPIVEELANRLGVPCYLDNDATAAGLGEWRFGAGRGVDEMAYITVSTGIGAGLVSGGRVLEGTSSNAGELGHVTAVPGGVPCHCGRSGCLETVASGTAIGRLGEERRAASPRLRAHPGPVDAAAVFAAAAAGDPVASGIVDEATTWLAWGVGLLVNILNPARIVIGGGVAIANGERLLAPVRAKAPTYAMPDLLAACAIVPAALGDKTGVAGALAVALEHTAPDA